MYLQLDNIVQGKRGRAMSTEGLFSLLTHNKIDGIKLTKDNY
jgi:hypothetical protein